MPMPRSLAWHTAYASAAVRLGDILNYALKDTPLLRVLEDNVCRNYYRQHDPSLIGADDSVAEELCKISDIQKIIADINGVSAIAVLIPSVLAALPYMATDQIANKKRLLVLNVIGTLSSVAYSMCVLYFYNIFDPRWLWLSGIFSALGGGDLVFQSLLAIIIAQSIPHESLSGFYLYNTAVALLLKVAGSAASLLLMAKSNWIPLFLALAFKSLSVPIVMAFIRNPVEQSDGVETPIYHVVPTHEDDPHDSDAENAVDELRTSQILKEEYQWWPSALGPPSIVQSRVIPVLIVSLNQLSFGHREVLSFWLSRRFHWSLREVGWVNLAESLFASVIIMLLPKLSRLLQRKSDLSNSRDRDLALSKLSTAFGAIGLALLGLSWFRVPAIISLTIIAGRTGFQDVYLSYLRAVVNDADLVKIYTLLQLVLLIGYNVGSSMISGIYSLALQQGDSWWTSAPMWTAAVLSTACYICLSWLH